MTYVVSLADYEPLPRYDDIPWAYAKIEEAALKDGPWTLLETVTLTPLDADPANPMMRAFTTHLATLSEGWYRVTFIDQTQNTDLPTSPVHRKQDEIAPYLPTLADLGAFMRSRTVDESGNEIGYFNADTRPTGEQALAILRQAGRDVELDLGGSVSDELLDDAQNLTRLRAAMLIELSYWPEQVTNKTSPYSEYKALYQDGLTILMKAVDDESTDDEDGAGAAGMARFSFPENAGGMVGYRTIM